MIPRRRKRKKKSERKKSEFIFYHFQGVFFPPSKFLMGGLEVFNPCLMMLDEGTWEKISTEAMQGGK